MGWCPDGRARRRRRGTRDVRTRPPQRFEESQARPPYTRTRAPRRRCRLCVYGASQAFLFYGPSLGFTPDTYVIGRCARDHPEWLIREVEELRMMGACGLSSATPPTKPRNCVRFWRSSVRRTPAPHIVAPPLATMRKHTCSACRAGLQRPTRRSSPARPRGSATARPPNLRSLEDSPFASARRGSVHPRIDRVLAFVDDAPLLGAGAGRTGRETQGQPTRRRGQPVFTPADVPYQTRRERGTRTEGNECMPWTAFTAWRTPAARARSCFHPRHRSTRSGRRTRSFAWGRS